MKKQLTQLERLLSLLKRKRGATSLEIAQGVPTVSPHRRLFELRGKGYTVTKKINHDGLNVYFVK